MPLTAQDVRDIAAYARIGLPAEEVGEMCRTLNDVISSLEPITHFDLEGVHPTFHPIAGLVNVMREDIVEPGLTQEEALANASQVQDGQFKIPPILGNGGGDR